MSEMATDNPTCRNLPNDYRWRWLKTIDVECPNCGRQIGPHGGHITDGRVFVCEKGKPPMREVKYYCENCGSTTIFLKKCEPEGVGNDR